MAPRVQFYHNTPDRLALAHELAAGAHARGRKVALRCTDATQLRRLDQALWTAVPLDFVRGWPMLQVDGPDGRRWDIQLPDESRDGDVVTILAIRHQKEAGF